MALRLKLIYATAGLAVNTTTDLAAGTATYSVLVKNVIVTNSNTTGTATVTLKVTKNTGSAVPITPPLSIGPKSQIIWDSEITLGYIAAGDKLTLVNAAGGATVDCAVNGLERDV